MEDSTRLGWRHPVIMAETMREVRALDRPKKQPRLKLTGAHRFTISLALRMRHFAAMELLDFHSPTAGVWLRSAGENWDAFRAFNGYTITQYE